MGTGAVSWSSKLQNVVALSTTEAEYMAAVQAGKEIKWMRNLMHELLSGVIPAPHLTSSQASTWVKTPQVGHVPFTI